MSDEYLRKDIYDANMAEIRALFAESRANHERIAAQMREEHEISKVRNESVMAEFRALMEASEERHERITEEIRGEVKELNARLEGFMDTTNLAVADLKESISALRDDMSEGFSRLGTFITALGVFFTAVSVILPIVLYFLK